MMAFKKFREEYEGYLDLLLGDDDMIMKHKIERIGNKYYLRSILRDAVHKEAEGDSFFNGTISRLEILKDKMLMELIERPKKLWRHLAIRVRNAWIERVVVEKQVKRAFEALAGSEEHEFKGKAVGVLARMKAQSNYWPILKNFLKIEVQNSKNIASFMKSYKQIVRNSFKYYFFSTFEPKEELITPPIGTGAKRKKLMSLNEDE